VIVDILIDIGNTSLKWALYIDHKISYQQSIVHHSVSVQEALSKCWENINHPDRMIIACVATENLVTQVEILAKQHWPRVEVIIAQTQGEAYGVKIAYTKAEKLGVDRWLYLLASRHFYRLPVCIIGCGTAVTVDVLGADGIHQGGMIAPGLQLMKQSLSQSTHRLPYDTQQFSIGLANDTEAAIYNGTVFSIVGLIKHVLSLVPDKTELLLTGGDAEVIGEQLALPFQIQSNLVLMGLTVILDKQ
jgi:type III pantothenate kinase